MSNKQPKPPIPYIGKRMTRSEFASYLKGLQFTSFKPKFVTLHHTGGPTLAQRPKGLSDQHLRNILHYYENTKKWSGAPHVFVDDINDGIIVFQRMDRRGVHAVSFNRNSWGLEMLGYYDTESFDTGRGAKVRDNSMHALAIMCEALGVDASTIKFHRDDPETTKTCPGTKVKKADVVARVSAIMKAPEPEDTVHGEGRMDLILPDGTNWQETRLKDQRLMVKARDFLKFIDASSKISVRGRQLTWLSNGISHQIEIVDIDNSGSGWIHVRDFAKEAKWGIQVSNNKVILSKQR